MPKYVSNAAIQDIRDMSTSDLINEWFVSQHDRKHAMQRSFEDRITWYVYHLHLEAERRRRMRRRS